MNKQDISMQTSVFWNTFGNIFYLFCQWILTVVVVRLLGMESNGYFTLAMALTNISVTFAGFGMRNFQISDKKNEYNDGTYIYSRIVTSCASTIFLVPFLLLNDYPPEVKLIIFTYQLFKISEVYFDVYSAIFQKKWRIDLIGKSLVLRGFITLFSFTLTLFLTKSLLFAILAMTICSALSVYFYDHDNIKKIITFKINTNNPALKKLLLACLPLALYSILLSTIGSFPRYFLEKFSGPYIAGVYGSISAPTIFVQAFTIQVFTPFLTTFTEYYHANEQKRFWKLFLRCITLLTSLTIVACIAAHFLGNWALSLLFGPDIISYTYILIPLLICTALNALSWLLSGLLTVIRASKSLLFANAMGTILCFILSLKLIPTLNLLGTTIAYGSSLLLISILLFISLIIIMQRKKTTSL